MDTQASADPPSISLPCGETRTPEECILNARTLVLNRSWMAVNITTVRRALTLTYLGCARIIDPETFDTYDFERWLTLDVSVSSRQIRCPSRSIRAPELIVLLQFDQRPALRVPFSRRNLFVRDNHRCQYCGVRGNGHELGVDHIVPRSRGGASTWLNCVLACHKCNVRKGNRTPVEAGMRLLRAPANPRWPAYLSMNTVQRSETWTRFLHDGSSMESNATGQLDRLGT